MNKRFYLIKDNKILLQQKDYGFPEQSIIQPEIYISQIEMGIFENALCWAAIPNEQFQEPQGFKFYPIKNLVRNTDRADLKLAGLAGFLCNWILNTKFCGKCGKENEMHLTDKARKCPDCGMMQYPHFSLAIIVAVIREDKILLAHNKNFADGMYSTIAGFVDAGETFEDCIEREILEEVGIKVKNIKYFGNQIWPFPDSHMIGFTAEYESGEIQEDGIEIEHADWFSVDKLPQIPAQGSISRELIDWFVGKRI
ncbi:MAG: NAD(+) diphosphatase [Candidatus Cloacimonadales bacterium]|nr:NAD(+) diphosphatase [Candidatus Cloacimonadales bacterium]